MASRDTEGGGQLPVAAADKAKRAKCWLAGWLAGGGGSAKGVVVTGLSGVWRRAGGRRKRRAGNRVGGGLLGCGVWKCFAMTDAILTRCWVVSSWWGSGWSLSLAVSCAAVAGMRGALGREREIQRGTCAGLPLSQPDWLSGTFT